MREYPAASNREACRKTTWGGWTVAQNGAGRESGSSGRERARTPGTPKSKMADPISSAALEQGRARERRIEITPATVLNVWKMADSSTIFHFITGNVTICGFGPTDNPEYKGGEGGTVGDEDRACAACKTAAKQQGVNLVHPLGGGEV